jgi:lipoprotein NlpD
MAYHKLVVLILLLVAFLGLSCAVVPDTPAASDATPSPKEMREGNYYTIKEGDTLYGIGKKFGVDWHRIAELNNMTGDESILTFRPGRKILLPPDAREVPIEETPPPANTAAAQKPKKPEPPRYVPGEKFIAPVNVKITVHYGDIVNGTAMRGAEFSCNPGTDVKAARTGAVVAVCEQFPGFGKVVIVDHGYGFYTFYGYLGKIEVKDGSAVAKGDVIGKSGVKPTTGKGALHFRIYRNGVPVNPASYIK